VDGGKKAGKEDRSESLIEGASVKIMRSTVPLALWGQNMLGLNFS
jgi:hypothetical protein